LWFNINVLEEHVASIFKKIFLRNVGMQLHTTSRRYNPEDYNQNSPSRENPKSYDRLASE
jgi:hypothetical protein